MRFSRIRKSGWSRWKAGRRHGDPRRAESWLLCAPSRMCESDTDLLFIEHLVCDRRYAGTFYTLSCLIPILPAAPPRTDIPVRARTHILLYHQRFSVAVFPCPFPQPPPAPRPTLLSCQLLCKPARDTST